MGPLFRQLVSDANALAVRRIRDRGGIHGQKRNCGLTGADKPIILQSNGDVKGAGVGWTSLAGKGGVWQVAIRYSPFAYRQKSWATSVLRTSKLLVRPDG
jgi:hypothetical protein